MSAPGKQHYPRWYDLSSAIGPERTVVFPDGVNVARAGDSLELAFADSSQTTNVTNWHEVWAQDGGKDFNFTKVYVPIDSLYTSSHFRFRFRLKAKDDFEAGNPSDDADAWFVKNVVVNIPLRPEIEISFVRIDPSYPYLRVPPTQADSIPIQFCIANNGGGSSNAFGVEVQIWAPLHTRTLYDRTVQINNILPGIESLFCTTIQRVGSAASNISDNGKIASREL